jgi:hypothetical protein
VSSQAGDARTFHAGSGPSGDGPSGTRGRAPYRSLRPQRHPTHMIQQPASTFPFQSSSPGATSTRSLSSSLNGGPKIWLSVNPALFGLKEVILSCFVLMRCRCRSPPRTAEARRARRTQLSLSPVRALRVFRASALCKQKASLLFNTFSNQKNGLITRGFLSLTSRDLLRPGCKRLQASFKVIEGVRLLRRSRLGTRCVRKPEREVVR